MEFKELEGFGVMEFFNSHVAIHDDKLTLRAPKKTESGAVNIAENFYKYMQKNEIVGYWNEETGEHIKPEEYDPERHKGWVECWRRGAVLSENVYIFTQYNQVDLVMTNLWENLDKRYKISLKAAFSAMLSGVIPYKTKTYKYGRNALEAVRNRLKRNFTISEYETDILLSPDLTEILENAFKSLPDIQIKRNTIFLKKAEGVTVKFYKPFVREKIDIKDLTNWARGGKIEITLKRDFFKRAGIRIENLGEQPEIFQMIKARIIREVKGMINTLSKPARTAVAGILGVENKAEAITQRMLNIENTITYMRRKMEEIERRVEALEKKDKQKKQAEDWSEGIPF